MDFTGILCKRRRTRLIYRYSSALEQVLNRLGRTPAANVRDRLQGHVPPGERLVVADGAAWLGYIEAAAASTQAANAEAQAAAPGSQTSPGVSHAGSLQRGERGQRKAVWQRRKRRRLAADGSDQQDDTDAA